MIYKITSLAFLIGIIMSCSNIPFKNCNETLTEQETVESRFIHQKGSRLINEYGNEVFIKAVNLGGWLHFKAWMLGADLKLTDLKKGSESQMISRLSELYGEEAAEKFVNEIHSKFIQERDFKEISALGFNAVRLPINHTLLDTENGWKKLDRAIKLASSNKLYVIIDMHAAPGGQSNTFPADPDDRLLWNDPDAQNELIEDWRKIAQRYKDDTTILAYDLLNEPDPSEPKQLIELYNKIIPTIREKDSEHLLLIEGTNFSRNFNCFSSRLDNNMAYSPHVYIWIGSNDDQWLSSFEALRDCHFTPILIGEYGEDRIQDIQNLRKGFESLSGWAVWSWKKVDTGGQPGISTIDAPENWIKLMKSLVAPSGSTAVMNKDEAFETLSLFLQAASTTKRNEQYVKAIGL